MRTATHLRTTAQLLLLAGLAACSAMPVAPPLTEPPQTATANDATPVSWESGSQGTLSAEEQQEITTLMRDELSSLTRKTDARWHINAVFRRVETVNPWLNWTSTLLVIVPVDRGGVAVDFIAQEKSSGKSQTIQFAEWTPMSDLRAQYSRLGPVTAGVHHAVEQLQTTLLAQMNASSPPSTNREKDQIHDHHESAEPRRN